MLFVTFASRSRADLSASTPFIQDSWTGGCIKISNVKLLLTNDNNNNNNDDDKQILQNMLQQFNCDQEIRTIGKLSSSLTSLVS